VKVKDLEGCSSVCDVDYCAKWIVLRGHYGARVRMWAFETGSE
jgi:hypothetical protein